MRKVQRQALAYSERHDLTVVPAQVAAKRVTIQKWPEKSRKYLHGNKHLVYKKGTDTVVGEKDYWAEADGFAIRVEDNIGVDFDDPEMIEEVCKELGLVVGETLTHTTRRKNGLHLIYKQGKDNIPYDTSPDWGEIITGMKLLFGPGVGDRKVLHDVPIAQAPPSLYLRRADEHANLWKLPEEYYTDELLWKKVIWAYLDAFGATPPNIDVLKKWSKQAKGIKNSEGKPIYQPSDFQKGGYCYQYRPSENVDGFRLASVQRIINETSESKLHSKIPPRERLSRKGKKGRKAGMFQPWAKLRKEPLEDDAKVEALIQIDGGKVLLPYLPGSCQIIYGRGGSAKSWLIKELLLQAEEGDGVAAITLDDGIKLFKRRLAYIGVDFNSNVLDGLHIASEMFRRSDAYLISDIEECVALLKGCRRKTLIIDPIAKAGAATDKDAEYHEWFSKIVQKFLNKGWTVVLIDHAAKAWSPGQTHDTPRGTGAKLDSARYGISARMLSHELLGEDRLHKTVSELTVTKDTDAVADVSRVVFEVEEKVPRQTTELRFIDISGSEESNAEEAYKQALAKTQEQVAWLHNAFGIAGWEYVKGLDFTVPDLVADSGSLDYRKVKTEVAKAVKLGILEATGEKRIKNAVVYRVIKGAGLSAIKSS